MRRAVIALPVLALASLFNVGCEAADPATTEVVFEAEQKIVGGSPDTTHKAVVALFDEDQGGACSGTIIAKSGGTGWILTAAHCTGMDVAVQANDYSDCFVGGNPGCEAVYEVVGDTVHPNYNGNAGDGYDFRVLTISGAAGAPVIPAATSPDGLGLGDPIEAVGYGITSANNQNNTLRRHVTEEVGQLLSLIIAADQTDGTGSCSGDSGGPIINNGKVVGVTSYGDQDCTQFGAYGRVATVYNSFIAPIVGQQVELTCNDCYQASLQGSGSCSSDYNACAGSQDCIDLNECFDACGNSQTCFGGCIEDHPTGWTLYQNMVNCGCDACATECASECAGSSSSSSSSSSSNSTNSSSSAGGAGGAGGSGNGGSGNGDGDGDGDGDGGGDAADDSSTCTISAPSSSGAGTHLALAFGLLAGVLGARRRRR